MAKYFRQLSRYLIPEAVAGYGLAFIDDGREQDRRAADRRSRSAQRDADRDQSQIHKWDPNWDRRHPPNLLEEEGIFEENANYETELEKLSPVATRNLFLIRHGQYNTDGLGDANKYLTPLGKSQAKYTGDRLREFNFPYSILVRSTMTRARETSDVILESFEDCPIESVRSCSLLEEGSPILPVPLNRRNHKKWPSVYFRDGSRIEAAFRKYFHRADVDQKEDSYEIIVCHGNVIRYFICRALQFPPDAWLRFTIHHCSITWLQIAPNGRVVVRCIGDSGHLPINSVTTS